MPAPSTAFWNVRSVARLFLKGFRGEPQIAYFARKVVRETGISPWYLGVPSQRRYAVYVLQQLMQSVPREGLVVEGGTGLGQMLLVLAAYGYTRLAGVELDAEVHRASLKLRDYLKRQCTLVNGDCLSVESFANFRGARCYMPLNWSYQHPDAMPKSVEIAGSILAPGGLFIIDLIPEDCPLIHHTEDAARPVEQRRPSEYRYRWNEAQFVKAAAGSGLELTAKSFFAPRWVYVCRKV